VLLVGGDFPSLPGTYILPCGEGKLRISEQFGNAHVTMETSSSGTAYSHPVVHVDQV